MESHGQDNTNSTPRDDFSFSRNVNKDIDVTQLVNKIAQSIHKVTIYEIRITIYYILFHHDRFYVLFPSCLRYWIGFCSGRWL